MATGSTGIDISKYEFLINKYQNLFTKNEREPFTMFGIECDDGWYDLLDTLLSQIDNHFKRKYKGVPDGFQIVQVKSKFGGLRFYVDGADDVVNAIINFAEELSYNTCEICGSNKNIMTSTGWIITACEPCTKSTENMRNRKWVKTT